MKRYDTFDYLRLTKAFQYRFSYRTDSPATSHLPQFSEIYGIRFKSLFSAMYEIINTETILFLCRRTDLPSCHHFSPIVVACAQNVVTFEYVFTRYNLLMILTTAELTVLTVQERKV